MAQPRIQQRTSGAALALLLISLASVGARAAGAEPAAGDDAKALYNEGKAQYALGHFPEALRDFEKVYLLRQLPALLFNIAQCHRQMKNFQEAAVTLRSFIRASPNSPQLPAARELLADVEEALRVQQATQTKPPLELNGETANPPASGPPIVTIAPPGPTPPLKPAPAPDLVAPQTPHDSVPPVAIVQPAEPPQPRRRLYTWIAGGAGVAALAVGGVVGLASKSTANDLTSTPHDSADITTMENKFHSQVHTANALFAIGGGLLVIGGVLYVVRF